LGIANVVHKNTNSKFDFYWKQGNRVVICYLGCNGTCLSGGYDPETKTLIGLPQEFAAPFFELLEK